MSESIGNLRDRIDALDDTIAAAIGLRRLVVEAMRAAKEERGVDFHDPAREAVIEGRYASVLEDVAPEKVHALVQAILQASR